MRACAQVGLSGMSIYYDFLLFPIATAKMIKTAILMEGVSGTEVTCDMFTSLCYRISFFIFKRSIWLMNGWILSCAGALLLAEQNLLMILLSCCSPQSPSNLKISSETPRTKAERVIATGENSRNRHPVLQHRNLFHKLKKSK